MPPSQAPDPPTPGLHEVPLLRSWYPEVWSEDKQDSWSLCEGAVLLVGKKEGGQGALPASTQNSIMSPAGVGG